MPGLGEVSMGGAIVDPKGQKPVRIGLNNGGLDMQATGEKIKEATLAGTKKQSDAIEKNTSVILPAISALQAKVQALQADAIALSNYLGDDGIENSFKNLQSTVTKSGEFSTASYVDVTIDTTAAKATTGAIAVRVKQLAVIDSRITADTITNASNTPISSIHDPLGISGSFAINGGDTISIKATDTLYTITSSINNSNSNVQATFIQNGSNYYLTLNGTSLAKPLTFSDTEKLLQTYFGINTSTPTDLGNLQSKLECDVVDGANGIVTKTYAFDSNIIQDLIPGVTLKLLNTTKNSAGGYDDLNINISHNSKEACDKILAFFQHYNEVREILNRNLMTDKDGNPLDPEAVMVRSPLIRKLNDELLAISHFTLIGAGPNDYRSYKDIGIVPDKAATGFQTGTFTIADAQTLLAAINNNFEKVKKLFGNYTTVSNGNFYVSDLGPSFNPILAGKPITVTLSNIDGKYYSRFKCEGNDTGDIEQNGPYHLTGKKDSVFDKIAIDYKGAPIAIGDSITFTMNATQGLGVVSSKTLDQSLKSNTGDFATEVKRVQEKNEKLEKQVKRVEEQAERDEKKWIAQAARYDAMKARFADFSRQLENMSMIHNRRD